MVAEILAGAALVKASITGIKSAIGAAKDIGAITKDIDNLFDATKQLNQFRLEVLKPLTRKVNKMRRVSTRC